MITLPTVVFKVGYLQHRLFYIEGASRHSLNKRFSFSKALMLMIFNVSKL